MLKSCQSSFHSTHVFDTFFSFFFNDTATTEISTLSLHYALPISSRRRHTRYWRAWSSDVCRFMLENGRGTLWIPVTPITRMPSSSWEKKAERVKNGREVNGRTSGICEKPTSRAAERATTARTPQE